MTPVDGALSIKLPCFPCHIDKRPATPHGFIDAAAEPDAIRQLWKRFPGRLVGVPTGAISGIDALDVDSPRHPEASTWLATRVIPDTRVHSTLSGGFHFLFGHHEGLRNSAGGKTRPGIDVRADGGYIIWWPCYGLPVRDIPIVNWPQSLLNALKPPKASRSQEQIDVPQDMDRMVRWLYRSSNGERNNRLYWAACRLADSHAGDNDRQAILSAAKQIGLSELEAKRTIESAFRRGH